MCLPKVNKMHCIFYLHLSKKIIFYSYSNSLLINHLIIIKYDIHFYISNKTTTNHKNHFWQLLIGIFIMLIPFKRWMQILNKAESVTQIVHTIASISFIICFFL